MKRLGYILLLLVMSWCACPMPAQQPAIDDYYDVMAQYKAGKRDSSMCHAFSDAGVACFVANRYVEALRFFVTAVDLSHQYGDVNTYEFCTNNIGLIYAVFRDYERAIHYFEKSYASANANGNDYNRSIAILDLVAAYSKLGDVDNALRCYRLQTAFPIDSGDMAEFYNNYNQGLIAHASKDYSAAIYCHDLAVKVAQVHGLAPIFQADANLEIGRAYEARRDDDNALAFYRKTVDIAKPNGYVDDAGEAYEHIADIYKRQGNSDSTSYYQSLWLSIRDSVYEAQQFNKAKDELAKFESRINDQHISSLKGTIWVVSLVSLGLFSLLTVILLYNRKLQSAYKMLVAKNEELIHSDEVNKQLLQQYINSISHEASDEPDERIKPAIETTTSPARDQEQTSRLLNRVVQVLSDVSVISDSEFSLPALAQQVESNTAYVSRAINEGYGKNFKTLLNEYRIREACRRLTDDEHYGNLTVVAIGESVGYKSATSFIQAFKKMTGVTPAVYKRLSSH